MDLSINYLGFKLPHPFMPGASPLCDNLNGVRKLEDAGAAAIVLDVGLMSGTVGTTTTRTCGAEYISASTVAQSGGSDRMILKGGFRVATSTADRGIGVKVTTAPATGTTTGTVNLIVSYIQE